MQLEGKVAIVTGAARGIGYAIAKRFLMDGASVVVSDVDGAGASKAARDLEQYGKILAIACDVGDKLDIHNLLTYTATNLGEIDILVNNAGIVHQADFLDLKEEDFDRVMRVNLKGLFSAAKLSPNAWSPASKQGRRWQHHQHVIDQCDIRLA